MSTPLLTSLAVPASSVIGTLLITSGFSYRMGKLVATMESMIQSQGNSQLSIEKQVALVNAALDRHEQWHLEISGRNGRRR